MKDERERQEVIKKNKLINDIRKGKRFRVSEIKILDRDLKKEYENKIMNENQFIKNHLNS